ncbi:proline-rich receptor-like protein kinase PERK10 isoform X2 [Salvia splendens]|uniref:proline-rich receptor-like protein kinase PERK10 isoform X2 n=1 Tax=Salvia splendens TaxID=180675 RepID=UPI001C25EEC6|nr:proline-rich receptor-like protein kinase PERK10 isoform X2 [Salvia splendens]
MGEDISMVEEEEIAAAAAAVNAAEEVVVEEEEDDDGPPPGFQFILTLQPPDYDDEEEEDGPPPGFNFVAPKPPQLLPSSDMTSSKQDNMDEDDDDGPPPGWEFGKLVNALENTTPSPTDISDVKEESNEDLDEGPPPGWESVLTCQMPQPQTPPLQPPSTVSSNCEMGSKPKTTEMDDEMHQSESEKIPTPGQSSPATPPTQQLLLSEQPSDAVNKEEENKNDEKRPTPMPQPASPLQQLQSKPHSLTPVPKSSSSEKAQLVCGTCRKLCLYPQGAKWIRCPGCQEVNFVLAAHEVGQVNCGGCAVLLMYPHGAPAVQCSSCRFVTEIGAHNRRPPLSIQQAQARDQRRRHRSTGVR